MKDTLKILVLICTGFVIGLLFANGCNKEDPVEVVTVEIPSAENSIEFENPVAEERVDTIYKIKKSVKVVERIVKVENPVNKDLLTKYEEAVKLNDSLLQLKLYTEAITERQYRKTLEDSLQIITVFSEVIGTLKTQNIGYITKPKKYQIPIKPKKKRVKIYAGGFGYYPLQTNQNVAGVHVAPSIGGQLSIINKHGNYLYNIGYDSQNCLHVGFCLKIGKL